jgi:glycosidase
VHDYYAINPAYGSPADLLALVQAAHALGIYVILDEELNETSWDNGLITTNPQYYVHTDGNPDNSSSIAGALSLPDVAQLNYTTTQYGLQSYMASMLESWLTTYGIDGFRFLTADVTQDGTPTIPASFWQNLQTELVKVNPNVLMWADEEDPVLAGAPFALDYGWLLRGGEAGQTGGAGLQQVANGADAGEIQTAWEGGASGYAAVLHTNFLENWDLGEDLEVYGGAPNTMAAATFDFTIDGVPMLWNGEEVGNDTAAADKMNAIDWQAPNAAAFTAFYTSLVALRNHHPALQQGTVTWIPNSAPGQVVSYTRSTANETLLVVISFASQAISGTVTPATSNGWTDVSPTGSPGGKTHAPPPSLALAPYDFAVFLAQ